MGISLSPELEARIRDRLKAGTDVSLEGFVERVLRQALEIGAEGSSVEVAKTPDQLEREVDAFFASIDKNLPPDTPVLSDKALTRDAIYEGRG